VRTEWAADDIHNNCFTGKLTASLIPVTSDGGYAYGVDWVVTDASSPLATGLAASWTDPGGYAHVALKTGAVSVATADGYPGLAYWSAAGSEVVYVNHDMTYPSDTEVLTAEMLRVVVNAATCRLE
jgi:hypothetical protein